MLVSDCSYETMSLNIIVIRTLDIIEEVATHHSHSAYQGGLVTLIAGLDIINKFRWIGPAASVFVLSLE